MTTKDAYKYFVLRAQEIAIHLNWTPVNWFGLCMLPLFVFFNKELKKWYLYFVCGMSCSLSCREETFNSFGENLNPLTVVHNW
jgi:hexosaminidase